MAKTKKKKSDYNYMMLPICVLVFIPTILRIYALPTRLTEFPWFSSTYTDFDMYNFGKGVFLYIMSGVMALMLLFAFMNDMVPKDRIVFSKDKKFMFTRWYVFIAIAYVLAFISTVISKYRAYGFGIGIFCSYENVYTLLCYAFVLIYVYMFILSEKDVKILQWPLLLSEYIVIGIGVAQHLGHHICNIPGFREFITAPRYRGRITYTETYGNVIVDSTLMNPNFVGVFTALLFPVAVALILANKNIIAKLLWVIDAAGLLYIAYYSGSKTCVIALFVELLVLFILIVVKLIKKSPLMLIPILLAFILVCAGAGYLLKDRINHIVRSFKAALYTEILEDLTFDTEGMHISYKGIQATVGYEIVNEQVGFWVKDENGKYLEIETDDQGYAFPKDEKYRIFELTFLIAGTDKEVEVPYAGVLHISDPDNIYGTRRSSNFSYNELFFYHDLIDDCYYYVTPGLRIGSDITKPNVWVFNNNLDFVSSRGYVWGGTLPLLPRYSLLGSGAETFAIVFPNSDYITKWNAGVKNTVCTKPHNWYMQVWVQQGGLSLLCQLIVLGIYLIESIRVFLSNGNKRFLNLVSVGILIGIVGYLIQMLTCDSHLVTAPIFWIMLGLGFAVNKILLDESRM